MPRAVKKSTQAPVVLHDLPSQIRGYRESVDFPSRSRVPRCLWSTGFDIALCRQWLEDRGVQTRDLDLSAPIPEHLSALSYGTSIWLSTRILEALGTTDEAILGTDHPEIIAREKERMDRVVYQDSPVVVFARPDPSWGPDLNREFLRKVLEYASFTNIRVWADLPFDPWRTSWKDTPPSWGNATAFVDSSKLLVMGDDRYRKPY